MSEKAQPVLYISHGGGPWPYIPEMKKQFSKTAEWLASIPKSLPQKPKAIVSVSAHWEQDEFTVSTANKPGMIFDYYGFPDYTYQISYPALGSASVAVQIQKLLDQAGIKNNADADHGFDHGTFVPLVLMYPDADIPVVSLSIKKNYDPLEHIRLGQALASLRQQNILIIGSGLSYHNMRGFGTKAAADVSKQFGQWLEKVVTESDYQKRIDEIQKWQSAPAARLAHPYEDHLIPLMVTIGAAEKDLGYAEFVDHVMGVDMASYRFGT